MFNRILIPTDGSDLSSAAAERAIELAKSVRADVCAFHATPIAASTYSAVEFSPIMALTRENAELSGNLYLLAIEAVARAAGVPCELILEPSSSPYRAIIEAAEAHGCDLIVIGSHGRGAMSSLIMGSVTQQVISHSFIPVLVYRDARLSGPIKPTTHAEHHPYPQDRI